MKCVNCGSDNAEGSKFCMKCGSKLEQVQAVIPVQEPIQTQAVVQTPQNKKVSTKLILCIVLGVLIIGLGTLGVTSLFNKKDTSTNIENKEEKIETVETAYIIIKDNDKYGIIDTNGNTIIPFEYDEISRLKNGYFYAESSTIGEDGYKDYTIGIYDLENKLIIEQTSGETCYSYDDDVWIINYKMYDKNLKQISPDNYEVSYRSYENEYYFETEDGTIGFLNSSGKEIFKTTDDLATYISYEKETVGLSSEVCIITQELRSTYDYSSAVINCETGKIIYDFVPALISNSYRELKAYFNDDSATEQFIIVNDEVVYRSKDDVNIYFVSGWNYYKIENYNIPYNQQGREIYIDGDTGEITYEAPDKVNLNITESDYLQISTNYCDNGKYQFVKENGEELTECIYDYYDYFSLKTYQYLGDVEKFVIGKIDEKIILISTKTGKEVAEFDNSYFDELDNTPFIEISNKDTDEIIIFNLLNQKSMKISSDNYSTGSHYIVVRTNGEAKYYNENFKLIYKAEEN